MTMHSWINRLFTRPATSTVRRPQRRFRPGLEALEDRTVPATFVVNSPLDDVLVHHTLRGPWRTPRTATPSCSPPPSGARLSYLATASWS